MLDGLIMGSGISARDRAGSKVDRYDGSFAGVHRSIILLFRGFHGGHWGASKCPRPMIRGETVRRSRGDARGL